MGLYRQFILTFLCELTLSSRAVGRYCQELLATASGDVLEIGFGTGLNLGYYPPSVRRLATADPNPGVHRRARRRAERAGITLDHHMIGGERLPAWSASIIGKARPTGLGPKKMEEAVRHLVGRLCRGDSRIPDGRARRAGPGAFAAEVRVSALQLLQSDTNPRSSRKHLRALTHFRGPSLCLNQTRTPGPRKHATHACPLAEGRSPDALATPLPIGLAPKNQKSVSSCRIAVTTLGDRRVRPPRGKGG